MGIIFLGGMYITEIYYKIDKGKIRGQPLSITVIKEMTRHSKPRKLVIC